MQNNRILNLVAALSLTLAAGVASAVDYSTREFRRDLETLHVEVFEPLAAELQNSETTKWRDYVKALLDRIERLESATVSPISYGITRDLTLTMAQNFSEFNIDGSWSDAEYYLRSHLELLARVMAYRDADSL